MILPIHAHFLNKPISSRTASVFTNRLILFVFFGSRSEIGVELVHSLCYLSSHFSLVLFWRRFLLGCIFVFVESEACLCFPAHFFACCHAGICKMPLRDEQGRFCGTLQRKEADGHWERNFFVLDEDKYLLRYFSYMNADQVSQNIPVCISLALSSLSLRENYNLRIC